jgi:hypothetical protein
MPHFKVLYIGENYDKTSKTDHRMFVLYDPNEGHYYYYGTRNREYSNENDTKYVEYSGSYSYDQLESLLSFLNYLTDEHVSLVTTELYHIFIHERDYNHLSFSNIYERCNNGSLLSAYDMQPNSDGYLEKLLNMLVCF